MGCFPFSGVSSSDREQKAGSGRQPTSALQQMQHSSSEKDQASGRGSAAETLASNSVHPFKKSDNSTRLTKGKGTHVIVIGAGLSGLIAADELVKAGFNVKVLEAQDRVGGRTLDFETQDGNVIEMGGQWIGPGQNEILRLSKELGLTTHDTYDQGKSLYRSTDGQVKQYTKLIPCGILPSLDLLNGLRKINSMSKAVPAKTPSRAKNARWYDGRSIGGWIDDNMKTTEARKLFRMAIKAVYAEDPESISFLDLLSTVAGAGGDIEQILSDAQTTRIVQGPQTISKMLASRLPDGCLQFHQKVSSISQAAPDSKDATEVRYQVSTMAGQTFEAPVVIITPPRPLICQINFEPQLPSGLIQYYRRQPMGSVIKFNVVYSSPFWRSAGLNGAMINADEKSPVQLTYDNSPADGKKGIIVAFVLGNNSRRFLHQNPDASDRRRIVLEFLASLFGPQASKAEEVFEKNWTLEPYATGGYGSFNPPGVLTSFEEDERSEMSQIGNLYFAGDATSEIWQGYMEGALLSGKSVARRIISSFS